MKIQRRESVAGFFENAGNEEKTSQKIGAGDFHQTFNKFNQIQMHQYFLDMIEQIQQQGLRMGQSFNINELRYYKKMIAEFLHHALQFISVLEEDNVLDGRGRHKKLSIIKKVNHKLEELVGQVVNKEQDHIAILKMIDDIRGLLIDLDM